MSGPTNADITPETSGSLTAAQIMALTLYGGALWFGAALLIRALAPLGALHGVRLLIVYLLVALGTVPFVLLMRRLARLRKDQIALGITVVTGAALLCDGCAFALIPGLYGANTVSAAATVFWGAGVGLVLGLLMNKPDQG